MPSPYSLAMRIASSTALREAEAPLTGTMILVLMRSLLSREVDSNVVCCFETTAIAQVAQTHDAADHGEVEQTVHDRCGGEVFGDDTLAGNHLGGGPGQHGSTDINNRGKAF